MSNIIDYKIGILDCTLRDGGYINNWCWGKTCAKDIINLLSNAGTDMIEVGFLRNDATDDNEFTVSRNIEKLNDLLPYESGKTVFAAMAMHGAFNINNLDEFSGHGISLIRITAHNNDIAEGLKMASIAKAKKYKVAVNPINIVGFDDLHLLELIRAVDDIHPFQFTIVDTFGCMKRRDLDRIVNLTDHNLSEDISLGLHLHENMCMSFSLAQQFINYHLHRPIYIDGSLMGIGRPPGNLPSELLANYLNEEINEKYNLNDLMDAIENYIEPLKGKTRWGYDPAYFLSAKYNLHRNYAEYLVGRGNLTNSDINNILSKIEKEKGTIFDIDYIENLCKDYLSVRIDDESNRAQLAEIIGDNKVLVMCPGKSIYEESETIKQYIQENRPIIIAVNFVPTVFECRLLFFSNPIRKKQASFLGKAEEIVLTSNIRNENFDYMLDYNKLLGNSDDNFNGFLMILRLLKQLNVQEVAVAGADGYDGGNDYFDSYLSSRIKRDADYNVFVKDTIQKIGLNVLFITRSAYENQKR